MAKRPAFFLRQGKVVSETYSFKWFSGFAVSQKQKSIESLHALTDIEFNPTKSINTQARAAAMIKLILDEYGYLPDFQEKEFIEYHKEHVV